MQRLDRAHPVRYRVHEILAVASPGDRDSRIVDISLIVLIAANVAAVVLESVAELAARHAAAFAAFELFSVAVFSVEYALRLWSVVEAGRARERGAWRERLRYAASPSAIIDLLAILPFYLSAFFAIDLRFLRVLRLLRVFKLTRYSAALRMLGDALSESAAALGASFGMLLGVVILTASGIYLVEHQAQPDVFDSIPSAMWWAVATLTTVGYGDVVPVTPFGRVFGTVIMVTGIGIVAIPAGLLASGFSEQVARRRRVYERKLDEALADGVIDNEEKRLLDDLRRELGMSSEDVDDITQDAVRRPVPAARPELCPHCGKHLDEAP